MSVVTSGEGRKSHLRNIFDSMAYDTKGTSSLVSIQKWLADGWKHELSCVLENRPVDIEAEESWTLSLDGLSKELGQKVQVKFIKTKEGLDQMYDRMLETRQDIIKLNSKLQTERRSKFKDLLKSKAKDLVQLEAHAANIPAWVVQKQDEPQWAQTVDLYLSTELRKQFEDGIFQVRLNLGDDSSYCLKDVIAMLSAAMQVDGHILVLIALTDPKSVEKLLPVFYLIDSINKAGIRPQPLSVAPILYCSMVLKTVVENLMCDKIGPGLIEVGDKSNASTVPLSAAINLLTCQGRSLHFVVDSSADIPSAVTAISRNTWFSGVNLNHRCRVLAFVQQPVYNQVIAELKNSVEKITVGHRDSFKDCDFIRREVNHCHRSAALSSVAKLGAKTLGTDSDFYVPTVVYDIGTSSDLVALKEPGLGHILVVIPYRNTAELTSLANNFGVPDQVLVYSNSVNTTMDMLRKLNALEIRVNSTVSPFQEISLLDSSWQLSSVGSDVSSISTSLKSGGNGQVTLPTLNSSKWRELSYSSKVELLAQLVDNALLSKLLSYYLEKAQGSGLCIPSRAENTAAAGIILVELPPIPSLITALLACILRDKPVHIISVKVELPKVVLESFMDKLPTGLISLVKVDSVQDIAALTYNLELIWVLQGQGKQAKLRTDFLPTSLENRVLLVNNATEEEPLFNAKIAIDSAFKKCYL